MSTAPRKDSLICLFADAALLGIGQVISETLHDMLVHGCVIMCSMPAWPSQMKYIVSTAPRDPCAILCIR